jgi:hypothetical protein
MRLPSMFAFCAILDFAIVERSALQYRLTLYLVDFDAFKIAGIVADLLVGLFFVAE